MLSSKRESCSEGFEEVFLRRRLFDDLKVVGSWLEQAQAKQNTANKVGKVQENQSRQRS